MFYNYKYNYRPSAVNSYRNPTDPVFCKPNNHRYFILISRAIIITYKSMNSLNSDELIPELRMYIIPWPESNFKMPYWQIRYTYPL